jgi:site-specific recombinase XerC
MEATDAINAYLVHLRYLNRRPSSISHRSWALLHLVRFAAPISIFDIDSETIRAFVSRESLGAEARNNAISHVRSFYRWAIAQGHTSADPTADLQRPRRPRRLPRPMPTDAVRLALSIAPDPIRQWLYLATYAGLRACEIAQLSGADFNLGQDPPVLIVQESKGGDTQFAVIGTELLEVAAELSVIRGWCFPKGAGDPALRSWGGHVSANQVQKRANQFLHNSGIPQTLHQLRHWFGTELLHASGGNLRIAQEGLRHTSANSTAIYTFAAPGEIARALDLLPRLTG